MNSSIQQIKFALKQFTPLRKQLIKFSLIGVLAVLVDLIVYYLLLNVYPEKLFSVVSNEMLSKAVSFICGMSVTYALNKIWTWKLTNHSNRRIVKFAFLYGSSLALNVGTNSTMLFLLYTYRHLLDLPNKYFIAFVIATGISASLNFAGQKLWVFKSGNETEEGDITSISGSPIRA